MMGTALCIYSPNSQEQQIGCHKNHRQPDALADTVKSATENNGKLVGLGVTPHSLRLVYMGGWDHRAPTAQGRDPKLLS